METNDPAPIPSYPPPNVKRAKVYSAPRRFDLATMFVVSFALAVLLGAIRLLEIPSLGAVTIVGYIVAIGLSQAILFRGLRPRLASVLVGGTLLFAIIVSITSRIHWIPLAIFCLFFGTFLGYVCGCFVGFVFMIAEALRRSRWIGAASGNEIDENSV